MVRTEIRRKRASGTAAKTGGKHTTPVYAGFTTDGRRFASLKDVRDPSMPTRTLADLTHEELVRLTVRRLSSDKDFLRLRMLGVPGVITRSRAIKEIKAGTIVGRHLLEIEKHHIRHQLEGE
jgi:hypothetical protein